MNDQRISADHGAVDLEPHAYEPAEPSGLEALRLTGPARHRGRADDDRDHGEPATALLAPPIEPPPGMPPSPVARERRGTAATRLVVALVVVLVLVAAGVTAALLRGGPSDDGAGYLEPTSSAFLNFEQSGTVTAVLVKPGDHVRLGQVLAEQAGTDLQAKLAADQSTLYADQARALELSGGGTADSAQIAALVVKANQQLSAAQTKASGSLTAVQSRVSSAQSALQLAQSTLAKAQQQYATAVKSCDAPDRTAASQPTDAECAQIRTTLGDETSAVNAASQTLSQAQLALQTAQSSASQQLALASSQAALASASSHQATPTPGSATDIAAADAAVSRDIAAVAADQAAVAGATIVSPVDGVVGSVGAQTGDYASPDGVHTFTSGGSSSGTASNGFQLFSSSTTSNSGSSAGSGQQPVAIVYSTTMRVSAQVSEHVVTRLHVGEAATVTLPALDNRRLAAVVTDLDPTAVDRGGKVYYLVDLTPTDTTVAGSMPGMTADVSFH